MSNDIQVLADTSFIFAVLSAKDKYHNSCVQLYRRYKVIGLPQPALTEVGYLLAGSANNRTEGNQRVARFMSLLDKTPYEVLALDKMDLENTARILEKYADTRLDFVDATIVALAERLNINTILTLDRRDFGLVKPRHCDFFELFPL